MYRPVALLDTEAKPDVELLLDATEAFSNLSRSTLPSGKYIDSTEGCRVIGVMRTSSSILLSRACMLFWRSSASFLNFSFDWLKEKMNDY